MRGRSQAGMGRSQVDPHGSLGVGEESQVMSEDPGSKGSREKEGKWEESSFWCRSPSKGMYSINRTSTGFSSVSATKSSSSSSFKPRITTQLTCWGQPSYTLAILQFKMMRCFEESNNLDRVEAHLYGLVDALHDPVEA